MIKMIAFLFAMSVTNAFANNCLISAAGFNVQYVSCTDKGLEEGMSEAPNIKETFNIAILNGYALKDSWVSQDNLTVYELQKKLSQ